MGPTVVTVGPLVASATTAIALSQTPPAGLLTLNGALVVGGVAVLDQPRTVLFSSAGNNSNTTFTIAGTSWAGDQISESLVGSNGGAVATILSYKTLSSISSSASSAAGLTVGTGTTASSPWVRLDGWAGAQLGLQTKVTGAANYAVQFTYDDPNSATNPVAPALVVWDATSSPFVGATSSGTSYMTVSPTFARVFLNSGSGSVTANFQQFGD